MFWKFQKNRGLLGMLHLLLVFFGTSIPDIVAETFLEFCEFWQFSSFFGILHLLRVFCYFFEIHKQTRVFWECCIYCVFF